LACRFANLIGHFAKRFGGGREICLYEAPGRVNLMGMHIDHRGGIPSHAQGCSQVVEVGGLSWSIPEAADRLAGRV
jgi:hypothetical protein